MLRERNVLSMKRTRCASERSPAAVARNIASKAAARPAVAQPCASEETQRLPAGRQCAAEERRAADGDRRQTHEVAESKRREAEEQHDDCGDQEGGVKRVAVRGRTNSFSSCSAVAFRVLKDICTADTAVARCNIPTHAAAARPTASRSPSASAGRAATLRDRSATTWRSRV